jgi:hypothetical protein
MHIEDQGHSKRCGHLGDKELAPFHSYCQILKSANLTAQLRLGKYLIRIPFDVIALTYLPLSLFLIGLFTIS